MRILPVIAAVTAAFLVVACSSPTPPAGVTVVNNFDAQRFLGTWYEIARFDHRFERGLQKVTANYSSMDDGGIQVINRGYNPTGRCGNSRLDKPTLPATQIGPRLKSRSLVPSMAGIT
jgi:lipocalin